MSSSVEERKEKEGISAPAIGGTESSKKTQGIRPVMIPTAGSERDKSKSDEANKIRPVQLSEEKFGQRTHSKTNPSGANHVTTNSSGKNSSDTNSSRANPSGINPTGTSSSGKKSVGKPAKGEQKPAGNQDQGKAIQGQSTPEQLTQGNPSQGNPAQGNPVAAQPSQINPAGTVAPHQISTLLLAYREEMRRIRKDPTLKAIWIVGLLVILLALIRWLPIFRIQKLSFSNLYFNNPQEVEEVSGLHLGQHALSSYGGSLDALLTGRYHKAERRILKAYPGIKSVEAFWRFPGEIRVNLEERIPVAFVENGDQIVLVDREGVACYTQNQKPDNLPIIKGIEVIGFTLGSNLKTNADADLRKCMTVMSRLVEADFEVQSNHPILPQVKEITTSGYHRVLLKIKPTGYNQFLTINCSNQETLKDDFIWLNRILQNGLIQEKLPGTLDIYGNQLIFKPEKINALASDNSGDQGSASLAKQTGKEDGQRTSEEKENITESNPPAEEQELEEASPDSQPIDEETEESGVSQQTQWVLEENEESLVWTAEPETP